MGCRDLPKNTLEMADLSKKTLLLSAESCTDSVSIVVTFGRIFVVTSVSMQLPSRGLKTS